VLECPKIRCTPWLRERNSLSRHKAQSLGRHPQRFGRDARDTFLGLAKTFTKLSISFWNYLGARLNVPGADVPPLANLILATTQLP
jgi:hypothetical protein